MAWTTKVTPNNGWDAGARTVSNLIADGLVEFEVGQAVGIVCGLNNVDSNAGYVEIDHAFLIEGMKVTVIEGGLKKGSTVIYTKGSTFGIERQGVLIKYYISGSLFYTSLIPSIGVAFLDCSLYAPGDTILDARITDYFSSSGIFLNKLDAFGTDLYDNYGLILLSGIEISNEFPIEIQLNKLVALGGDGNFGFITLSPLDVNNDTLVPDSNYAYITFSPLVLQEAADVVAEGVIKLKEMIAFGTETDGVGFVEFLPITVSISTGMNDVFLIDFPFFTGYAYYNDTILTIPAPTLHITGTVHTSRVEFTIPAPILTAYSGASIELALPAPTLDITGTTQNLGRVEFEIPEPTLTIAGFTGAMATVDVVIPAPELVAYSGGVIALTLPALEFAVAGTVSSVAHVAFEIPALTLTVTGEVYGLARVSFEIPAPELYAGLCNRVEFTIPAPLIAIVASHANTSDETTYAVNLTTGAVTQLLLGGFDRLVTAHGRLYGLKDGALTRLEGDVDGTVTTITATIRFAQQDFGTNAVKRCSDVYWSTREMDGLTMELIADERTIWRYQTPTDTAPAYGTHKIKTGRGVSFHTAGLTVRNRDGGQLDIGGVELLVGPLSRKPK